MNARKHIQSMGTYKLETYRIEKPMFFHSSAPFGRIPPLDPELHGRLVSVEEEPLRWFEKMNQELSLNTVILSVFIIVIVFYNTFGYLLDNY